MWTGRRGLVVRAWTPELFIRWLMKQSVAQGGTWSEGVRGRGRLGEKAEQKKLLYARSCFVPTTITRNVAFHGTNWAEATSLSSCCKHFLWLRGKLNGVSSSHHHSHLLCYVLYIHQRGRQKKVILITSANNQPVRPSKQYKSISLAVWYFTVSGNN